MRAFLKMMSELRLSFMNGITALALRWLARMRVKPVVMPHPTTIVESEQNKIREELLRIEAQVYARNPHP